MLNRWRSSVLPAPSPGSSHASVDGCPSGKVVDTVRPDPGDFAAPALQIGDHWYFRGVLGPPGGLFELTLDLVGDDLDLVFACGVGLEPRGVR